MDYDELLKNFEDDGSTSRRKTETPPKKSTAKTPLHSGSRTAPKTPPMTHTKPAAKSTERPAARTRSSEDTELERLAAERRKRVENFKVDISSNENKTSHSGIYLSNDPRAIADAAQKRTQHPSSSAARTASETANTAEVPRVRTSAGKSNLKVSVPPVTEKQKKAIQATQKKKSAARKSEKAKNKAEARKAFLTRSAFVLAIIALISVILCVYGIGCINDVLAIKTEEKAVEVTVSPGMSDGDVISILKEKDLINNKLFCKLFIKFLDKGGEYASGVYTLTPDMGIEKMLATMKADVTLSETVTLTFPEGWTIEQIAEKLETNKVCTATSFITTLQTVDFSTEYSFLASLKNSDARFRKLEGYLYPDTYDFYIGETASSVVRKFLTNFNDRWTEEYAEAAKQRGLTVDDVMTVAALLQKEAATAEQMPVISSILFNRLSKPSTFPWLQCDSTETYLLETIKPTLTSSTEDTEKYIAFRNNYDTYSKDCVGLPVGPICNPGDSAINAALNPQETDYYYFRHDKNGEVYYASTFAEHEQNGIIVEEINGEEE